MNLQQLPIAFENENFNKMDNLDEADNHILHIWRKHNLIVLVEELNSSLGKIILSGVLETPAKEKIIAVDAIAMTHGCSGFVNLWADGHFAFRFSNEVGNELLISAANALLFLHPIPGKTNLWNFIKNCPVEYQIKC